LAAIRAGNVAMVADNLRRNPHITPAKHGFGYVRPSAILQWRLMHRICIDGFDRTRFQTIHRMLLDWGVDPNVRNEKGETNLHMCASYGRDWSPSDEERAGARAHPARPWRRCSGG
jgi:ankyrin repeat protein